jgi:hypothetical protein
VRANENTSISPESRSVTLDDGHKPRHVVETFRELSKRFKVLRKVGNIVACKTAHQ